MTLGEKIKKYRELRELTQRELGQKVGFSAGTEDSRIRKYEKNMMAPQTDILSVSIYLYYLCQKLNVSPYLSFLYPFRIFLQDKIML